MAALPIVGIAPILVMWFGFDWQRKRPCCRDGLLPGPREQGCRTCRHAGDAARPDADCRGELRQGLAKLRLPSTLRFIFNGLKTAATLALVRAIVAEFSTILRRAWLQVLKQAFVVDPMLQRQADCISTMTYNEYGQILDAGHSDEEPEGAYTTRTGR